MKRTSAVRGHAPHGRGSRRSLYGIRLLPAGRRRTALQVAVTAIFDEDFIGRTLPYDNPATDHYADIVASRRSKGRPISQFDAMIAAIVRSRGATLATRNTRDFAGCGIDLVDPWAVKGA